MKKLTFISTAIVILFALPILTYANTAKISGMINYQGEKNGQILIATFAIPPDLNEPLHIDTLDAPGYYEITDLTAGTYFIGVYMDVNGNRFPGFDEPVGLYPAPIQLDSAGIAENIDVIIKDLPTGAGAVSGKVNYIGVKTGEVHVYALGLTKTPFTSDHFTWGTVDSFNIDGLFDGEYLIVAFLDENGNKLPELTEPMGVVETPVTLQDGEHITDIEIMLFDTDMYTSSISGNAFYSGHQQGEIHIIAAGLSFTPINEIIADSLTGDFKVENLAAGEYRLFSYLDADASGSFDLGEPFAESYLDKVTLGWGQDTTGIELFLQDQGTGAISGTISYFGPEKGLITPVAAGLSATYLMLGLPPIPHIGFNTAHPYTINGLAPGYYAVASLLITGQGIPSDIMGLLELPLGFYLDDFIYVEQGDTVTDINFTIEDTTNNAITGTIIAPEDESGEVYIISLGLSKTPFKNISISEFANYEISGLGSGRYIVAAFMDVNGDSMFNLNEPVGFTEQLLKVYPNSVTENVDIYLTKNLSTGITIETEALNPKEFALQPNYPNPFNPSTTLSYDVPQTSHVTINIYNLLGKKIVTLLDEEVQAGTYQLIWETKNIMGQELSSGVYICRMQSNDFIKSRKMMLIR